MMRMKSTYANSTVYGELKVLLYKLMKVKFVAHLESPTTAIRWSSKDEPLAPILNSRLWR